MKVALSLASLLALSGLLAIFLWWTLISLLPFEPASRVQSLSIADLPQKVSWFITRPVVIGLRPFLIDSPEPLLAMASALPALVILILALKNQSNSLQESLVIRAFAIALPLALASLPMWLTPDNQFEWRIAASMIWGIGLLVLFSLGSFLQPALAFVASRSWFGARWAVGLIVLFLIGIPVYLANARSSELYAQPYDSNVRFISGALRSCDSSQRSAGVLVVDSVSPFPQRSYLGDFSMVSDLQLSWTRAGIVEVVADRENFLIGNVQLRTAATEGDLGHYCVIDLSNHRDSLVVKDLR